MTPGVAARSWLSLSAAARYAGVGRDTLRAAVSRGELPAARLTDSRRAQFHISKADIDAWMQSHQRGPYVWDGR